MYLGSSTSTIAEHTSFTMRHTAVLDTPKRCPMVRQSVVVANHHKVMAIRCSTDVAFRITVSRFWMDGRSSLHKYVNVLFDILKFSIQSFGVKVTLTIRSHQ